MLLVLEKLLIGIMAEMCFIAFVLLNGKKRRSASFLGHIVWHFSLIASVSWN